MPECKFVCRCDCYIMKDILQNWSDEEAALILQNLHSVMHTDHRLLIIETILHIGSYSEERVSIHVSCMFSDYMYQCLHILLLGKSK